MFVKNNPKPKILIVEGNIGAGKSTFLKILRDNLACQVVYEPLLMWQNVGSEHNLLEKFYVDTPRWAYTFQSYAFITRTLKQKQSALKNPYTTQILERSVFSDRHCFAKNLFETGKMNNLEWTLYLEWFSWFLNDHVAKPDGFIYLRTTPQTCHNRLLKRNRKEEQVVPLQYLEKLHEKHETWLIKKENVDSYIKDTPVLALECDTEFEGNEEQQSKLISQIISYFDINYLSTQQQNVKNSSLNL